MNLYQVNKVINIKWGLICGLDEIKGSKHERKSFKKTHVSP